MNILLDMDGVIVDFVTGLKNHYKVSRELVIGEYNLETSIGVSRTMIKELPFGFWTSLPKTNFAVRLENLLQVLGLWPDGIIFCSLGYSPEAISGKAHYLNEVYPGMKYVIDNGDKTIYDKSYILIDDCPAHCAQHGDNSILVPAPWNYLHNVDPIEEIKEKLCRMLTRYI